MMKRLPLIVSTSFLLTALTACGEHPQTGAGIRSDSSAYAGTGSNFTESGWKAGDKASWEAQLKVRQQYGQNEYIRTQSK